MKNNELKDINHGEESLEDSVEKSLEESKNILIIKGKFKFLSANMYGIFAILIDETNCNLLEDFIFVSYFSDLHFLDIKQNWSDFENQLNQLKISGEYAESITNSFKKSFDECLHYDSSITTSIITDYKTKDLKKIYHTFEEIFGRLQKDRHVNMELHYEEIHFDEIKSTRNTRIDKEKPPINENILTIPSINIDPFAFNIPANPVLAPISVNSIKSQDLEPGKKILMRINSSNEYGQQWVQTFNAFNTQKGEIIPIVGTVDQVGPIIKKSLDILVTYNTNQYTKFNIETDVKIKLYDHNSPEQVIVPNLNEEDTDSDTENNLYFDNLYKDPNFRNLVITATILFVLSITALFFI